MKCCEGCRSKSFCRFLEACYKTIENKRDIDKCPCSICLVKVVCNEQCEEFRAFYHETYAPSTLKRIKDTSNDKRSEQKRM